jgi:hypothetical protein
MTLVYTVSNMSQTDMPKEAETGIPIDWPQVEAVLVESKSKGDFNKAVVNTPFTDKLLMTQLGLGIIVFLLVNEKTKTIDRIALSDTYPAQGAVSMSAKKFEEIKIPIDEDENIIARAVRSGTHKQTSDWHFLFTPDLSAEQARFNQAGAGISSSVVYPLDKTGALIFSYYMLPSKIGAEQHDFMQRYSALVTKLL